MPCSREEVWRLVDGALNGMEKFDIFAPETFDYRVVSIILYQSSGSLNLLMVFELVSVLSLFRVDYRNSNGLFSDIDFCKFKATSTFRMHLNKGNSR